MSNPDPYVHVLPYSKIKKDISPTQDCEVVFLSIHHYLAYTDLYIDIVYGSRFFSLVYDIDQLLLHAVDIF